MAEGNKTYMGLAVPLFGESVIEQQTAATDILTLTGADSQSGDFLVCQSSTGTEKFVVAYDGALTVGGAVGVAGDLTMATDKDVIIQKTGQAAFGRLRLPILFTAAASAGLVKGDLWLQKATTDIYRLAMCTSTAAGTVLYGTKIQLSIGSAS